MWLQCRKFFLKTLKMWLVWSQSSESSVYSMFSFTVFNCGSFQLIVLPFMCNFKHNLNWGLIAFFYSSEAFYVSRVSPECLSSIEHSSPFVTSMMDNHIQNEPIQQVFYQSLMKCGISISGCRRTAARGNTADSSQQSAQNRHILYRCVNTKLGTLWSLKSYIYTGYSPESIILAYCYNQFDTTY